MGLVKIKASLLYSPFQLMCIHYQVYSKYVYCSYIFLELKDGRIPQGITRRMGYWKAEEYLKFTFPASEHILDGVLPEQHYNTWILMVRIVELVFGCCRNGWTPALVELLKQLIWRHNILTEEVEGLTSCTISLHNLTHLPDDIVRHSSPDNYWCFVFERAVHKYVEKSSNNKNLEYTFAKAECRRELLKFCQSRLFEAIEQHQPGQVINP